MAWNEPGGDNKDPWGNRGKQGGPPDLDEAIRNLQKKFGAIFGGGGGGGAGLPGGGALLPVIAVVAVIVWGLSGLYTVEEGKQAVILQFGAYTTTMAPGLHWYPRFIQTRQTVDVSRIRTAEIGFRSGAGRTGSSSVPREALMLTQDENIVDIQVAVQYRVKDAKDYLFKLKDPDLTLSAATETSIREIIGKSRMDFVLTEGRGEIGSRAKEMVQHILDIYESGLIVTRVNLLDAQPPEQVQHAFADAVKAREDEQRLKNEAEAYANDIIPKARGAAARQLEEANGYKAQVIAQAEGEASRFVQVLREYEKAPQVTRERLYLDAVESVLSSVSKVMIDVEGGNNLLYLPLDRFVGGRGPLAAENSDISSDIAQSIVNEARERGSSRQAPSSLRSTIRSREVR